MSYFRIVRSIAARADLVGIVLEAAAEAVVLAFVVVVDARRILVSLASNSLDEVLREFRVSCVVAWTEQFKVDIEIIRNSSAAVQGEGIRAAG